MMTDASLRGTQLLIGKTGLNRGTQRLKEVLCFRKSCTALDVGTQLLMWGGGDTALDVGKQLFMWEHSS